MVKGRLDGKATTATGYAWFVWEKAFSSTPRLMWIPPCRKALERPLDYDAAFKKSFPARSSASADFSQDLFDVSGGRL
jgi:hypothetical protein